MIPTGSQVELRAGDYRAVVVEVGGGIRALDYGERPVLEGYPETAMADGGRGQLLIPWPNRIADGRYTFDGQERQLELSEPARGNASHGLTRWLGWTIAEAIDSRALLTYRLWPRPGYPHLLDLAVTYELDPRDGLRVTVAATNSGDGPAPFAVGAHPYLHPGPGGVDVCELHIPASTYLPVDDRLVPTGFATVAGTPFDFRESHRIGGTVLDTCFTDLAPDPDGRITVTLRLPDGWETSLWLGPGQPYVQVFSADTLPESRSRMGLAVEPMSAPANTFNSGDGLLVLQPGATHTVQWGVTASRQK